VNLESNVYFGDRHPFKFLSSSQPRLELEVSHFSSDISSGDFNGGDQSFRGDESQIFILINSFNEIRCFTEVRYFKTYGVDAERRFINDGANGFSADVDNDPDRLTFTVSTAFKF